MATAFPISQAAAGTTHVVTGITGQRFRLLGAFGAMSATGTLQFKSSGGTALSGAINLTAGQPADIDCATAEGGEHWFETLTGEGLDVVTGTGAFNGMLTGYFAPG